VLDLQHQPAGMEAPPPAIGCSRLTVVGTGVVFYCGGVGCLSRAYQEELP
jgi:hypothetical protein